MTTDERVARWLYGRQLDPATVADRHLAGVLPGTVMVPEWARAGERSWIATGHRLILPLFDEHGEVASFRARALRDDAWPAKTIAPRGYSLAGLVLADALGRAMLASHSEALDLVRRVGVVVVEGEPDHLTWATRTSEAHEDAPAVLGLVAGSWSAHVAARIPAGTRVVVRTHRDDSGDRYAEDVVRTLTGRCEVLRAPSSAVGGSK